ncbi:MAG TPA: FGGY-family carbohydrate kinase [Candidatus Eisenbergiella pullicola]|nr:FGGY-family carbohydrate kinase [Candidatus Eisenbergiella pullicola]
MKTSARETQRRIACLTEGRTVLGIEFGSTRIKAVLIDETHEPIAVGSHDWENRLENKIWTYSLEDIWNGLRDSYRNMAEAVERQYGVPLTRIGAMGFSGMMHGYMAFDEEGNLLVPFRTWRNTMTGEASQRLSDEFGFQIPQRWSIAHLYQAILNGEDHVERIAYLTTLAGYIHWKLTGKKVLGIGEASGMFPIDSEQKDYDAGMLEKFDALVARKGYPWKIREILPEVLTAGEEGGILTEEGAALLDETGALEPGVRLCPPEGDAGTGMTATDSVAKRTGNVSAGTSVFSMVVLEKPLSALYPQIDTVTTPCGDPVAMVHCNNCTSDLNAWVGLFSEFADLLGVKTDMGQLFSLLYRKALEGEPDCGGLMAYNYFSGEHITGFEEGRPLFLRCPDSRFDLADFMRSHLYAALGTLKVGMDILLKEEKVKIDRITGHGGLFKTPQVGQKILAAALNAPVSVMETAGEGGAWGIALLAAYMLYREEGESLDAYLKARVFAERKAVCAEPDARDVDGFERFIERYRQCLPVERAAVDCLRENS